MSKGNPNIVEYGKATRFGEGQDPSEVGKKGGRRKSIIKKLKEISDEEFDEEFSEASILRLIKSMLFRSTDELTAVKEDKTLPVIVVVIASAILHDISKGSLLSANSILDRVMGKANENITVKTDMSYEEAKKRIEQLDGLSRKS